MKKLFLALVAVAAILNSCSKDDSLTGVSKSQVSFTVSAPEMATRYGDGKQATTLYYGVYDPVEGGLVKGLSVLDPAVKGTFNGKQEVTLHLVEGRTYSIIFYAQNAAESPYLIDWEKQIFKIDEAYIDSDTVNKNLLSNKETYDAFYAYVPNIKVESGKAINQTVELKRPFAQLNILTDDLDAAKKAAIDIDKTEVTVTNVGTSMDLTTGKILTDQTLTYSMNNVATGAYNINGTDYTYLAMNYLLVNKKRTVNVTFKMNDSTIAEGQKDKAILTRTYGSVYIERNHRTNIYGSIITNPATFNVVIEPNFIDSPNSDNNYNGDEKKND